MINWLKRNDLTSVMHCMSQNMSHSQKVMSWNPIPTQDSYGSKGSSYRRTRNRELSSLFSMGAFAVDVLIFKLILYTNCGCTKSTQRGYISPTCPSKDPDNVQKINLELIISTKFRRYSTAELYRYFIFFKKELINHK
ncbi:hypothetical protein YC2023_037190 [Brassica napus]